MAILNGLQCDLVIAGHVDGGKHRIVKAILSGVVAGLKVVGPVYLCGDLFGLELAFTGYTAPGK